MTLPSLDSLSGLQFTPDVVIALVLALSVVYGLILGHNKLKTLALSVYVGVVLAGTFGRPLFELLQRSHFDLNGRLGQATVQLIVFGLPVILLEFGRKEHGRKRARGGFGMTFILCVLTAALVISSALALLDPTAVADITGRSILAKEIYTFRLWWLALVPAAVIGENFIKPKEH
jgi:hypothetical protein